MPIEYARFLIGRQRSYRADRQLGWSLAAVAGAINAGGFLAVGQYTSHVTGAVSSFTDNFVLGETTVALTAVAAVAAFMGGAMTCAIMVNFARRRDLTSEYALPLLLEAALILTFGLAGSQLSSYRALLLPLTVMLLSFLMGLQNAMVTKLSERVIRTTHMTGIVTDLGIELGRLVYWNRTRDLDDIHFVQANRDKLFIHASILGLFFVGGIVGALAFKSMGFSATIPIALLLVAVASPPVIVDIRPALLPRRDEVR